MIDSVLFVLLIGVMPARALYKDLLGRTSADSFWKKYIVSSAIIVGLLALLCYAWLSTARPPALLGLDIPLTNRGMIGLVIAISLLAVLGGVAFIAKRKPTGRSNAKAAERLAKDPSRPRTHQELTLFLAFALLAGCGWELLYRGFLIWFLVPHVGTAIATCIAAMAYGAAHGFKSRNQFVASMLSAFAFTVAFVLTGSLWWLMLIHTAAGIAGGVVSYKAATMHRDETVSAQAEVASS
jgi:membrane protease YdiL (CAAX protease family)